MASRFQTLRGFNDLLPGTTEHWQSLETRAHELFRRYGFREIRTPHLEPTELFVRSVGQATDIVGKEMFRALNLKRMLAKAGIQLMPGL